MEIDYKYKEDAPLESVIFLATDRAGCKIEEITTNEGEKRIYFSMRDKGDVRNVGGWYGGDKTE